MITLSTYYKNIKVVYIEKNFFNFFKEKFLLGNIVIIFDIHFLKPTVVITMIFQNVTWKVHECDMGGTYNF